MTDSGVGIFESVMDSLFTRFHRVQNTQGRSFEGSGIGLAMIQELVKVHDGILSVESQLGQGSNFIVTLKKEKQHLSPERIEEREVDSQLYKIDQTFVEEAKLWSTEDVKQKENTSNGVVRYKKLEEMSNKISSNLDEGSGIMDDCKCCTSSTMSNCIFQHSETIIHGRILLVDDNKDMRLYLSNILKQYWIVDVVTNRQKH